MTDYTVVGGHYDYKLARWTPELRVCRGCEIPKADSGVPYEAPISRQMRRNASTRK